MNTAKLFESPRGTKEQEKAAAREKAFFREYGELQAAWYLKLVDSGMDADAVYDNAGRRDEASSYDEAQEHFYARIARFEHVADDSDFQTSQGNIEVNKRVWHLYAVGQTEREIADNTDLSRRTIRQKLETLTKRYKITAEAGKLLASDDTKAEVVSWNRLQAIGRKYLNALANNESLGNLIVDSVTDSGCLVPRQLPSEALEALNNVTASLSLALGGSK